MTRRLLAAVAALTLVGAACGDDDDFNEPDVGEQQRQACVDSGKVALIDDRMIIGCVTVEQYNEMRNYVEETSSP